MKVLDFVRTPKGAIALVTDVSGSADGVTDLEEILDPDDQDDRNRYPQVAIEFIGTGNPSGEKNAWWFPNEGLTVVDSMPNLMARLVLGDTGYSDADKAFPR